MPLESGRSLGRYEILGPIGAGGMGEVYRARDTRLDREVAIKILPESVARDSDRLARFEREAKVVAALSHPNILALHDAGSENGVSFAVTELLQGETLRDRLAHGPVPVRRAVEIVIQIARGLAAAHAKSLVHRDLKPDNVFLVADGQVKILDFGLAKAADAGGDANTATLAAMTDPGTVLGTVGYMAPEQIRGQAVDARTDLFALGAVLYEMLTGERAFRRDTAAETMTAILREDVPELPAAQSAQSPALDRIIRHCLEKNPAERFQSARDVAFALEALSGSTGSAGSAGSAAAAASTGAGMLRTRAGVAALAVLGTVAVGVAAWLAGFVQIGTARGTGSNINQISYQRVTFDEGFVFSARFARDARTIVYSADWDNQTRDLFVTSLDNSGARALGYKNGDLLAVASDGALAILLDTTIPIGNPYFRRGTIARASLTGGAPRRELDRVSFADFAPDGSLAVTRSTSDFSGGHLEWPQGQQIVTSEGRAWTGFTPMPNPRVSPDGSRVAFFMCAPAGCRVIVADRAGKTVATSPVYSDWWGLAWTPDSREVWYSVVTRTSGYQCTVFALDSSGQHRLLFEAPGAVTLHDVSADRRILASFDQVNGRIEVRSSATAAARDLSWKEGGLLRDVALNGVLLFGEVGDSGGPAGAVYIRRPDEAEPLRVSDGIPLALSDDGTVALVRAVGAPLKLSIVPTTGLARPIDIGEFEDVRAATFIPDGRLALELKKTATDASYSVWIRPSAGGNLSPFLPAGFHLTQRALSPDGKRIAATDDAGRLHVCAIPASGLAKCAGLPEDTTGERVAGWASDNSALFVYRMYPTPVRIDRVHVDTGRREMLTSLQTAMPAVTGVNSLFVTPAGAIVYGYARTRSVLYAINGLR